MAQTTQTKQANIHAAMIAVSEELHGKIAKTGKNTHLKSTYAQLPDVTEAVQAACAKHGLYFTQHLHNADGGVYVETVVHHVSGESISSGQVFIPANKHDAQGYGSAITYGRRYSLMALFGVAGSDDDGEAAVASSKRAYAKEAAGLDAAQLSVLNDEITRTGTDIHQLLDHYRVGNLADLTWANFRQIMKALQARPAREVVHE